MSSGSVATSAVQAAIALLTNVAHIGSGLVGCADPPVIRQNLFSENTDRCLGETIQRKGRLLTGKAGLCR